MNGGGPRTLRVQLEQGLDGRWRATLEESLVARAEADRPSASLAALAKLLDAAAGRTRRPEVDEARDPSSVIYCAPNGSLAPAGNAAASANLLRQLRNGSGQ